MKIVPSPPQDSSRPSVKSTQVSQTQSSSAVGSSQSGIQVGDLVKGMVVSVEGDGTVTIESPAGRFSSKSLAALLVGDRVLLEIVKAGDTPLVAIVSDKSQQLNPKQSTVSTVLDQVGIQSGELIKGRVLSVEGQRLVTIEPVSGRATSQSRTTLSVGDKILLKSVPLVSTSLDDAPGTPRQLNQKQSSGTAFLSRIDDFQLGDLVKGKVVSVDSHGLATIESGAGRFSAKPLTAVAVGDSIVVKIVKAGEKPVVEFVLDKSLQMNPKQAVGTFVGSKQAEIQAAGTSIGSNQMGIKASGVVSGSVVSVDSQGQVTVETEEGRFSAKSLTALSVGDQILLEVVKAVDTLPVTLASSNPAQGKGQVFDILRVLMPWLRPGNATNFQGLFDTLQTSTQDSNTGNAPLRSTNEPQLAQFLAKNSAAAQPDPLQHIKIASLVSSLKSGSPFPPGLQSILGIAEIGSLDEGSHPELKKMAQLLESHAALNSKEGPIAPQPQATHLFDSWIFPCFFANRGGTGEWLFSFEQNKTGDQEKECCVTFYLNMSKLGDVHLKLNFNKTLISGVFTLESNDAAEHMQGLIGELQETLKPVFGSVVFTCNTASEKVIEKLKIDLQKKSGLETYALIDLSA